MHHGTCTNSFRLAEHTGADVNTQREINTNFGIPIIEGNNIVFSCWIYMANSDNGHDSDSNYGGRIGIDFYSDGVSTGVSALVNGVGYGTTSISGTYQRDGSFVEYGTLAWTEQVINCTVPVGFDIDACIPWMQILDVDDAGYGWFSDTEFFINPSEGTIASTELINWESFTTTQINNWINILDTQGMPEFTLRILANSDFQDGTLSSTVESKALSIISASLASGIMVNIDIHTWYTTWDNYFDDSATGYAAYRATYLNYVNDTVTTFNIPGIGAIMVLNEPQAQTATASENNFIYDCVSMAQNITSLPVSVRFMAGYSPSTGHYNSTIDSTTDFLARNTYWNPLDASTTVYGTSETVMNTVIALANSLDKELWITEFGSSSTSEETQRIFVEGWVNYANEKGIDRIYCWASSPTTTESYNIFTTSFVPKDAFYELVSTSEAPSPTATPTATSTATATPTGTATSNPIATLNPGYQPIIEPDHLAHGDSFNILIEYQGGLAFQHDNLMFYIEVLSGVWDGQDCQLYMNARGGSLYFISHNTCSIQLYHNDNHTMGLTVEGAEVDVLNPVPSATGDYYKGGYEWNATITNGAEVRITWNFPRLLPLEENWMLYLGLAGLFMLIIGILLTVYAFRHYKFFTLGTEETVWEKDILPICIILVLVGAGLIIIWLLG